MLKRYVCEEKRFVPNHINRKEFGATFDKVQAIFVRKGPSQKIICYAKNPKYLKGYYNHGGTTFL